MQVQSLETTVETLGQFMLQLVDKNNDIEIPSDVRRIIQQIGHLERQRKKPIFMERKIGKSLSVNANIGFPMKVLEELECHDNGNKNNENYGKPKSAFFENTYMQLRKQSIRSRPNIIGSISVDESSDENAPPSKMNSMKNEISNTSAETTKPMRNNDGFDSGIATPLSPKENSVTSIVETIPNGKNSIAIEHQSTVDLPHPFGNCEDINFNFSGTTQLKSLRPIRTSTSIVSDKHIIDRN